MQYKYLTAKTTKERNRQVLAILEEHGVKSVWSLPPKLRSSLTYEIWQRNVEAGLHRLKLARERTKAESIVLRRHKTEVVEELRKLRKETNGTRE